MPLARTVSHVTARTLVPVIAASLAAIGCKIEEVPNVPVEPCATAAECDDGDVCTIDTCVEGVCGNEEVPECDPILGCIDDADCDDGDECTMDVCEGDDACYNDPIPDCGANGPLSGVADMYVSDDGDAMVFAVYATSTDYEQYLEEEIASANMPVGTCALISYNSPGGATLTSMGDLIIMDGTTVVTTVSPDANFRYDSYETPFTVSVDDELDLILTGAPPATTESTITDAFTVPPLATFTNLTFTGDTIDGTITYAPIAADRLYLTFQYYTTEPVVLRCRLDPASGTFTMDPTTYAALGASGTVRAEINNLRRGGIHAADQDRSLAISTTRGTASGSYTKAP